MPKPFSYPVQQNKKRISLRIPKSMHADIISTVLKTGKSTRDFSAWVSEAIINLSNDPNYHEIVIEELLDRGDNISRPISLSPAASKKLTEMKENIMKKYNFSSDINSKIIRTAVTQQLIKEEFLQ